MSDLSDFLRDRGYVRIPMTRSAVGHFHATGTLNARPVEVMVDTGAACTVVAMAVVGALGLEAEWLNREAGGAGGALDQCGRDPRGRCVRRARCRHRLPEPVALSEGGDRLTTPERRDGEVTRRWCNGPLQHTLSGFPST